MTAPAPLFTFGASGFGQAPFGIPPNSVGLAVADNGNGSVTVSWDVPSAIAPTAYNVYVNSALNQTVAAPALSATITGLQGASYNAAVVPPAGDGSHRPESLPPVGKISDAQTYDIRVVPVLNGVEVGPARDIHVTPGPTSVMLVTPMPRGRFAFPNTPGGY